MEPIKGATISVKSAKLWSYRTKIQSMIRILIYVLLFSPFCFSQSVDSLQGVLKSYKTQDSTQVDIMINLAQGYLATGVQDSIFPLAERIIETSSVINFEEGLMQGNYIAGEYFSDIGQFKKAIPYLFDGITYAEKRDDKSMEARFSKNIAFSYMLLKDAPKAIEWFQKSSDLFGEIGQERFQVLCLASIGTVYYTDSLNEEAVPFFEKALSQAETMEDPFVLTYVKSQYALTLSEHRKNQRSDCS